MLCRQGHNEENTSITNLIVSSQEEQNVSESLTLFPTPSGL